MMIDQTAAEINLDVSEIQNEGLDKKAKNVFKSLSRSKTKGTKKEETPVETVKITFGPSVMAACIIVLLFIHPSLFEINMEMFNCIELDGIRRLSKHLETECYTGKHAAVLLTVALPSIVLWGLIIPIFIIIYLCFKKRTLNSKKTKLKIGYLYNGYRPEAYWWEPVIMLRKMAMISLSTFGTFLGKRLQTINVFIIMIIFLAWHSSKRPFKKKELNNLETLSILTLSLTVYVGLLYVSQSELEANETLSRDSFRLNAVDRVFLVIVFYSSNVIFILVFLWLFLIELRRYTRLKYPKVYQYFLCLNKQAIQREKEALKKLIKLEAFKEEYFDFDQIIESNLANVKQTEYSEQYIYQNLKELTKIMKTIVDDEKSKLQLRHVNTLRHMPTFDYEYRVALTPEEKSAYEERKIAEGDETEDIFFKDEGGIYRTVSKEALAKMVKSDMNLALFRTNRPINS